MSSLSDSISDIRDNLVSTAVKFLTNPNVKRCTIESKERFLRSKGLTDAEIQLAMKKVSDLVDVTSMTSELMLFRPQRTWFKDNVLPIIIYGGFAYGVYWFYKTVLRDLIFIEQPKKKTTAQCLEDLQKTIEIMNSNITSLRSEVQSNQQANEAAHMRSQIESVKCDIASVKGILLNRNQFPSIKTRTEPACIPAWQRQSEEATSTESADKPHRVRSQRSVSGGSNSSEGEQATKNSDSSLEIIT